MAELVAWEPVNGVAVGLPVDGLCLNCFGLPVDEVAESPEMTVHGVAKSCTEWPGWLVGCLVVGWLVGWVTLHVPRNTQARSSITCVC